MDRSTWIKIVAVIVVIIIIVAVVAAYFLLRDDKKDSGLDRYEAADVLGNANGDYYIDEEDEKIIQDIIDGERDAAEWPLADANNDGKVDEADLKIVQDYINGVTTTLVVIDCDKNPVQVKYPVGKYATATDTNFKSVVAVLGLAEPGTNMVANASGTNTSEILDKALYEGKESKRITDLSSSSAAITQEGATTLLSMGVELVLSDDGGINSDDDIVKYMEDGGITYLKLKYKTASDMIDSVACLGILLGCEKTAEDYGNWCQDIMDTIEKNEGSKAGTATCLSVVMSNYVSGTTNDYYTATLEAGGDNVADWDSNRRFNAGDTWMLVPPYSDVDCIFHFRSTTFPTVTESYFSDARSYFGMVDTFNNGGYYLINGVTPLPVRLALMAEKLYPDCFSDGWADSLFEYYFTHFLGQEWENYEYYWNVTATSP